MDQATTRSAESELMEQDSLVAKTRRPFGTTLIFIYLFLCGFLCIFLSWIVVVGSIGDGPPSPADIASLYKILSALFLLIICFWGIGLGVVMRKKWSKIPAIILSIIGIVLSFGSVIAIPFSLAGIVAAIYLLASFKIDWRKGVVHFDKRSL